MKILSENWQTLPPPSNTYYASLFKFHFALGSLSHFQSNLFFLDQDSVWKSDFVNP